MLITGSCSLPAHTVEEAGSFDGNQRVTDHVVGPTVATTSKKSSEIMFLCFRKHDFLRSRL